MASIAAVWRTRALQGILAVLTAYGIWATTHALWVLTHGGSPAMGHAFDYPAWSALHFAGGLAFVIILPFQLSMRVRARYGRAHRVAGRIAAAGGALFATTGVLLPFVMPARPLGERVFMTAVSALFAWCLLRGIAAARRHDFSAHRAWMLRVTALALGPLTQRLIFPVFVAAGIDGLPRFWDLFETAAWISAILNLWVAEVWIGARREVPYTGSRASRDLEPRPRTNTDAISDVRPVLRDDRGPYPRIQ